MVKLFPHQQEALDETVGFKNVAVYHDMGLGKTYTGSEMMIRFNNKTNLVVCQKSKVSDWLEHFTTNYSGLMVMDLTKKKQLEAFMDSPIDIPTVAIINYDLIWRRPELLKLKNFTLMLDESSLIQNHKSKRTKFILKLKPTNTIELSGTPVGGKFENLWSQLRLLGCKITKTKFDDEFVNWKLMDFGGARFKMVDKANPYKNIDKLKKLLRDNGAIFKKTEEVVDLPQQNFIDIKCKPTADYKRFMKDAYLMMKDGTELIGDTSLTKLLYARQLCSQYNKNKLDEFKALLESTNDRLIVFYQFNGELNELKKIATKLDRPISEINGHRKDLTAYENEENSITFCQYQSASKGINLQKANKIVYFTLPLGSEDYEQSKKRIHRIGQEKACFYYVMTCKGTVEQSIMNTLKKRRDYTNELFVEENC